MRLEYLLINLRQTYHIYLDLYFPMETVKKNVWLFGHSLMQHCYLFKKKPHKYMTQNENHCNKNCNFLEKEIIVVGTSKIQRKTVFMLNFLH